MLEFLLKKVAGFHACSFIKKWTLTQVFSCGYCEIFKNIQYEKRLQTGASETSEKQGIPKGNFDGEWVNPRIQA